MDDSKSQVQYLIFDCEAIAESVFPPGLHAVWRAGRSEGRTEAFFASWVRFEALAKATGRGIAQHDPLRGSERMTCRSLAAPEGFAAAVASRGTEWEPACWCAPAANPAPCPA